MQSASRLTFLLCCLWAATILYGEMIAYWTPFSSCSWPQPQHLNGTLVLLKVAVVADPQVMDRTSLSLPPDSLALGAVQFYTDLYMRRSFRSSVLPFDPHVLVFLGDHFDGGPFLSDQEWQESLRRFRHIFSLETGRKSDISVYYLSGNHDIGYSSFHSLYPKVISRYEQEFGARNYHFSAGKVDFIVVDAQTLDGPVQKKQTSSSWDFIKNVSKVDSANPRILLTHIPLYRPDDTPCGPYRSSSVINQISKLSQQ